MPYRKATRALRVVAALAWAAAITLTVLRRDDTFRSLAQGVAATASIAWLILWTRTRDGRRFVQTSPDSATWVSRSVPADDSCIITMQIPKVKMARMEEHVPADDRPTMPLTVAAKLYRLGLQSHKSGNRL